MAQQRVPQFIPGYARSYALLSNAQDADTAVIFVHGFGGKPTSTWRDFQSLVDEYSTGYPWWRTSDLFFYAYESRQTPIRRNADLLGNFAEDVWRAGWQKADLPNGDLKYSELIFVGHSEGGVVIRRLVLDRYESIKLTVQQANPGAKAFALKRALKLKVSSDFVLRSHLRLFAPACMGTNFSSWVGFLTSFSHFVAAFTASSLVRQELQPSSPILSELKIGTESAHMEFPEVESLFTRPLFGIPDQIVFSESYRGEKPLWDPGYDHFGVCKPTHLHRLPLEFVRK